MRCGRFHTRLYAGSVAFMARAATVGLAKEDYEEKEELNSYQINIVSLLRKISHR